MISGACCPLSGDEADSRWHRKKPVPGSPISDTIEEIKQPTRRIRLMANPQGGIPPQELGRSSGIVTNRDVSDQELLRRFLGHRDETAFAALLHRHGSIVWGVCRRML